MPKIMSRDEFRLSTVGLPSTKRDEIHEHDAAQRELIADLQAALAAINAIVGRYGEDDEAMRAALAGAEAEIAQLRVAIWEIERMSRVDDRIPNGGDYYAIRSVNRMARAALLAPRVGA